MTTSATKTQEESQKFYSIQEILAMKIAPFKDRKLRHLIWNGELKKQGKYDGKDYIFANNIASGKKIIWSVPKEEVLAWLARKK